MRNILTVGITAMTLLIVSCSDKSPPPTEQVRDAIPQAQLDALNKAKNVENVMNEQADKTREAADSQ